MRRQPNRSESSMRTSAVITGIGLHTPVGRGVGEVFDAMCEGRSGLRRPPEGHPVDGSLEVGGFAADIDPRSMIKGPAAGVMDRYILLAMLAAADALADAGIVVGRDVDPGRIGVIASSVGGLATLESQVVARTARGRTAVSPYLLPGMLPNMAAARIAIAHDLRGYSSTTGTACAAGAQAIAEGLRLIRDDLVDVVVCGGSEAPLFATLADTFGNARALAGGWADPTAASRPFDTRRNGFVLSEGAGIVVLERAAHADARGAAGYADVVGWGATTDAHHPTTPRPDGSGAAECMRRALADAGVAPDQVGYVNAHGTATKLGDIAETMALRAVFGTAGGPAVSSSKGVTGHMLGASGAVEAAACAVAIGRGLLPPTHNLDEVDPACELDHIRKAARRSTVDFVLSNSFGFGGQNLSLLFGPPSTRTARFTTG